MFNGEKVSVLLKAIVQQKGQSQLDCKNLNFISTFGRGGTPKTTQILDAVEVFQFETRVFKKN